MDELCALIDRHCAAGFTPTDVPRLTLVRITTTEPWDFVYRPLLCVLARGRKRVRLGHEEFCYDPQTYLVASAELPASARVIEAPALGLALELDPATLAAMLPEMPALAGQGAARQAMTTSPLGDDLRDPLRRLLRLLDSRQDVAMLAPLIEREILYRLLSGPCGEVLRQLALPSSQLSQISRAIALIRRRFDQKLRVEELARTACMSVSSFHRYFRVVTTMSPHQFQKRIRLQEARRLLLSRDVDASRVSFDVGYESVSQFSREYRRLFGLPPASDAARARRVLKPRRGKPGVRPGAGLSAEESLAALGAGG